MSAVDEQALAEFYVSDLMDWRAAFTRSGFKPNHKLNEYAYHGLFPKPYTTLHARNITHFRLIVIGVGLDGMSELTLSLVAEVGYELKAPTSTAAGTFRRAKGMTPQCFIRSIASDRTLRRLNRSVIQFIDFLQTFEFLEGSMLDFWMQRVLAHSGGGEEFDDLERHFARAKADKEEEELERANRSARGKRLLRATVPVEQPVKLYRKIGRDKKFRRLFPNA